MMLGWCWDDVPILHFKIYREMSASAVAGGQFLYKNWETSTCPAQILITIPGLIAAC